MEQQRHHLNYIECYEFLNKEKGLMSDTYWIYVNPHEQKLLLLKSKQIVRWFLISTAIAGIGTKENSLQTPYGLHKIEKKIGDETPNGAIFKNRVLTGEITKIYTDRTKLDQDFITTRILWLQGLEASINQGDGIDSFQRYIYIHGTPEEGLIGEPASHGCVRMKNLDILELYNLVSAGTFVYILNIENHKI